jgi:hypothetical protein
MVFSVLDAVAGEAADASHRRVPPNPRSGCSSWSIAYLAVADPAAAAFARGTIFL